MSKPKTQPKSQNTSKRRYNSETVALQSLRLIAAPNPKDDLSDAELLALCKDPTRSPALIQQLIECIRSL